jgi:hypothetical protein
MKERRCGESREVDLQKFQEKWRELPAVVDGDLLGFDSECRGLQAVIGNWDRHSSEVSSNKINCSKGMSAH